MSRALNLLAPIALVALLLAAWEAACRLLHVPPYLLPPPSAIVAAGVANAPVLLSSAWNTLSMALLALLCASVFACTLALLVATNETLERTVQPLAVTIQVTPIVAIAPLVVIWAGFEHPERATVILATVVAFFPIFSSALTGFKSADPDLERLFDLYGANRLQRLFHLRLPAAVPFLLVGHKVAGSLAVVGAVVAEFVAGSGRSQGLAWRLIEAQNRLQTAKMFAALAVLAVMGAGLYGLLSAGEKAALHRWRGR